MRDLVDPDAEGGRGPEARQPPEGGEPNVLEDVERVLGVVHEAADEVQEPLLVDIDEPAKRFRIALPGAENPLLLLILPELFGRPHQLPPALAATSRCPGASYPGESPADRCRFNTPDDLCRVPTPARQKTLTVPRAGEIRRLCPTTSCPRFGEPPGSPVFG